MNDNLKKVPVISVIFILLLLFSCGRNTVRVPTITDERDDNFLYGKFVWHDLVTDNIPLARDFYGELFGWEFEGRGGDGAPYLTAVHNDRPVAGLIKSDRLQEEDNESRWISYISVSDVDKAAENILLNGGLIYSKPADIQVRGRYAIVGDQKGAAFGLLHAEGGDPVDSESEEGTWYWNELITDNPQNIISFYTSFLRYDAENQSDSGYIVLSINGIRRAGITKIPWEKVKPNWLPYLGVNDIESKISRAQELGASIILNTDRNLRNGSIAIISDPTGAILGLQELSK